MTVLQILDIRPDEAKSANLFIFGYTSDPRGLHMLTWIGQSAEQRWVIGQTDIAGRDREAPDSNLAVEMSVEHVPENLARWIDAFSGKPRIAIDISCMPRPTMAAVFQTILEASERKALCLDVLYVLAQYTPPLPQLPPNHDIRPINDWFAGWPTNATASTSLVVGLGYERDKASGACEYFDANETWVFVPQSSIEEYQSTVEANNEALLARARRRDLSMKYHVERPTETFGLLASTVARVASTMNPVLLPFGPKIFFALSLLVAAVYREAGVWHVTGDSELPAATHVPSDYAPAFRGELGPTESQ